MWRKLMSMVRKPKTASAWLVDRDGRVYLPTKRVVLRGAAR